MNRCFAPRFSVRGLRLGATIAVLLASVLGVAHGASSEGALERGPVKLPVGAAAFPRESVAVRAPFPMDSVVVPLFPSKDFVITDYGAVAGGEAKVTDAIAKAVDACHRAGGGRVVVPRGEWLTGKVHLKSGVTLHVEEGATLNFSDDPSDYLPEVRSSWEGLECLNYSPLVYAFGCTDVGITGKGTLNARMDVWKKWFSRPKAHMEALRSLYMMCQEGEPVEKRRMAAGENHLRPQFIQFNRCRHVRIDGVKVRNSPFWSVHLLLCDQVLVRDADISAHGHNNDGVDVEMSSNVVIERCRLDQGDDAIAVKAGMNHDGWRLATPSRNIVIRNCEIAKGHQMLAIGSEVSGGIRNVLFTDSRCTGEVGNLLRIKTNIRRGGFVEGIHVENISGDKLGEGVLGIDTDVLYQWRTLVKTVVEKPTRIADINIRNVRFSSSSSGVTIKGDARAPISGVTLEDVRVARVKGRERSCSNTAPVEEKNVVFNVPAGS